MKTIGGRSPKTAHILAIIVLAASAALTACTSDDDDAANGADDAGTSDTNTSDMERESALAAGVDLDEDLEAIASGTVTSAISGAEILVEFYGLERRGEAVVGTYSFTVSMEPTDTEARHLNTWLGADWRPAVIDMTNLAKHLPVQGEVDSRTVLAQTQSGFERGAAWAGQAIRFNPDEKFWAFAIFAAPPEGVDTMDAIVTENMPVIADVPIQ